MPNSNINSASSANLVKGGVSAPKSVNMQDYNAFDRSSSFYQTQRFADLNPIFAKKFISGDRVRIRSAHELRSYTLQSPLMSNVYMHRSFFSVPLQAIYHNTFKPFFVNPIKGNDIPNDVKPMFPLEYIRGNSNRSIFTHLTTNYSVLSGSTSSDASVLYLNLLFLLIQMFSKDGLLQKLGYSISGFDVDKLVDMMFLYHHSTYQVNTFLIGFTNNANRACNLDCVQQTIAYGGTSYRLDHSKFRSYLYDLINNKYEITSFYTDVFDSSTGDTNWVNDFTTILGNIPNYSSNEFVNLEKLFAYQMVCAQFFTNSYVDDIHDSRSWISNILSIIGSVVKNSASAIIKGRDLSFSLNGVRYDYDLISKYTFVTLLLCTNIFTPSSYIQDCIQFCLCLRNMFEVQYSLRTSDYFVDARTQPLAVGDVYSAVSAQGVSAIDVNVSLWKQRFLNAVNRLPYHIEEYLKGIFGYTPETKEPKPFFISKERFLIGGQEVENTSNNNQGNVVTNLRTQDSQYIFETSVSEPSIVIGINSYSMDYAYGTSMDKEFLEFDRFDNFNPYMQHAGDQALFARELDNNPSRFQLTEVFAYQLRYMQYKKSIPAHASGGFLENLPSWIALYEKTGSYGQNKFLNSDFIRNSNADFDAFYSSLTGTTPVEYFHFINRFDTICHVNSKQQKYPSLM